MTSAKLVCDVVLCNETYLILVLVQCNSIPVSPLTLLYLTWYMDIPFLKIPPLKSLFPHFTSSSEILRIIISRAQRSFWPKDARSIFMLLGVARVTRSWRMTRNEGPLIGLPLILNVVSSLPNQATPILPPNHQKSLRNLNYPCLPLASFPESSKFFDFAACAVQY